MTNHTLVAGLELLSGVGLMYAGATCLIRGASRWAVRLRLSPTVIGLTVVAFGTTVPELAIGMVSAARGHTELAIATALGSGIFNVLAVLGVIAIIVPMCAHARFIRREVPLMVAAALFLPVMGWDGRISRMESGILLAALAGYVYLARRMALAESDEVKAEFVHALPPESNRKDVDTALVFGGMALLTGGAWLSILGAQAVATQDGLSDTVIGLTLLAGAASLPELITSLVAALRREPDVAMGNIVGGNIYNTLGVIGASAMVRPLSVNSELLRFDIPVLVLVSMALWPVVWTDKRVGRGEGFVLLGGYVVYVLLLVLYSAPRV